VSQNGILDFSRKNAITHSTGTPETALFGAPAQNTRTPEYHTSRNGILGFSRKNAISGNVLGIASAIAASLP
jgi:hypothetical protein